MKSRNFLLLTLCLLLAGTAAKAESPAFGTAVPRLGVKLNSVALVGIVNPAVEFSVHEHFTVNTEIFGCFYPNGFAFIKGRAIISMAFLEGRWYPRKAFDGFFVGPNVGFGVWNLSKGIHPQFKGAYVDSYQAGRNFMCGVTLGYLFSFSRHWGMELSLGGGYSLSGYEGHVLKDGSMYIGDNASAEWLPYKAAVSVVYKW